MLGSILLPNTPEAKDVAAWMEFSFKRMGDHAPNRDNEIHLSKMSKSLVYVEYMNDIKALGSAKCVSSNEFENVWRCCYPYVKARSFLNVCGKCTVCGDINEFRSLALNPKDREDYTRMALQHRSMFMGERRKYYDRKFLGSSQPQSYVSTISDGMQQAHCQIPYRANQTSFQEPITQHLQGTIRHGQKIRVYRSMGNLEAKFNAAMHCWLLELDDILQEKGRLPSTVFHQIDGGPENANWETLAMGELLIAKRLTDKVVITRLPVGHTHEVRNVTCVLADCVLVK